MTFPHDTVGVGKVIIPLLLIWRSVPDGVLMALQPEAEVTATRAYEPPDTSVLPFAVDTSLVGLVVNNPTQVVTGAAPQPGEVPTAVVGHVVPFIQLSTLSVAPFVNPAMIYAPLRENENDPGYDSHDATDKPEEPEKAACSASPVAWIAVSY
jgi:hypothetical protein